MEKKHDEMNHSKLGQREKRKKPEKKIGSVVKAVIQIETLE